MKLNFCPDCAAPLVKKSLMEYECSNRHIYWNDVRTTVGVVLFKGNKILVSKRGNEPYKGLYDLPGGFLDYGEDVVQAAVREMHEETGLDLSGSKFTMLTSIGGKNFANESICEIIVMAENWRGVPEALDDSEALEWKELDFLSSAEFMVDYASLKSLLQDILKVRHEVSTS